MALFSKKSPAPAAAPAPQSTLPACTLTRDGQTLALDADASALLCSAWTTKQIADDAKEDLDALNGRLLDAYGPGCVLEIPGQVRLALTERETISITDAEQMKSVLGGRFEDLVETRLEYKLSDKLKAMLADGDHPLSEALRACCAAKTSSSVTYRPVKP